MKKFLLFVIYFCLAIIANSCICSSNNQQAFQNQTNNQSEASYHYVLLTPSLISKLGGFSALYNYQFYPSEDFELTRTIDSYTNGTEIGTAQKISTNEIIKFTTNTSGIYKSLHPIKSNFQSGKTFNIDILFDEGDDACLTFWTYRYDNNSGSPADISGNHTPFMLTALPRYKGKDWNSSAQVKLMIRFSDDEYKTIMEVAKGRTLKQRN